MSKKHGPHCIQPDEVGAAGMCCCDEKWDEWDDYEEAGPMDLEDQLERLLTLGERKATP